jgi:predicted short-subunit dehydrogenase-like oxidoreductase (DUF2520 family)
MKIVIIGTGNVAHVFGKLFLTAGHTIGQVFGRNGLHAQQLAVELNTGYCSTWSEISEDADLYLLAVSDKALYELHQLHLPGKTVVHTAGSVPMDVLKPVSSSYGIIYPLQSLRKEMPVLTRIPLLVNSCNEETSHTVLSLARSVSADVTVTTDKQRLEYHVAAVFINNFTNHLYAVAEHFCEREGLDFSLLFPLAAETARRLETGSPSQALTGPAIRNDLVTINKHLELLDKYPLLKSLYSHLTDSIRQFHARL